jgi:hypothetical protein
LNVLAFPVKSEMSKFRTTYPINNLHGHLIKLYAK